jgi:hypothetical protein
MPSKDSNDVSYDSALSRLADGLLSDKKYKVGTFKEFLINIWSQSYDNPEYFKAWHVQLVADDIEECLETGLNYVAVLPRFHFKSTVLGHAFSVWRLLTAPRDCSVLYLSYSDGMAQYHIAEINKTVKRNPILMSWMNNKSPKADYSFRYSINDKPADIMHGGLFSFKRGMHVNGALIADDILRDPENPLNMGQITKVEDHFMTESLFIPLKGVPVIVLGTPMMPGDILSKLQEDSRFKSRVLPALDPVPGRRVLMPELYNEEWLLEQQKARPKSFASEFMLIPHFSTESYFEAEDLEKCESSTLINCDATIPFPCEEDDQFFAGFDVGKKRHPSHLVIFRRRGDTIEQVHSSFLDGWNYSDQIDYLNKVSENFDLNKGYVDNTRGELEERGLDNIWKPMIFSTRSKNTMAQIFETYLHSGNLHLIKDERQKQQILSVNNELKAPETPLGHGDAFFSIAMALSAAYETTIYKIQMLGNVQDWFTTIEQGQEEDPDKMPGRGMPDLNFQPAVPSEALEAPNPDCQDAMCNSTFWVPENKLCIYCGHRG